MSKIISMHRGGDGIIFARFSGDVTTLPSSNDGASVAHTSRKDNAKSKRGTPRHQPTSAAPEKEAAVATIRSPSLKPQNASQRQYIRTLTQGTEPIIIAHGPAGTGKTYVAVLHAILQLQQGLISKIIITRPNVGAGDDLGFLPGDLTQKMAPWTRPIIDCFREFYSAYQVEQMIKTEVIEIAPLVFMRGRTLKNALIIADETQNATPAQVKMLLTRIGENARMILTGDIEQYDRIDGDVSGLKDLIAKLARWENEGNDSSRFAVHGFNARDVVRHEVIEDVLSIYA